MSESRIKILEKTLESKLDDYSGPQKWDSMLMCIFNQKEIQNGQKKVQQGI